MKKERNSKLGYAKNGWLYKEKTAGYIFSAPFIFGFLFFVIVPVATSLYYAFCNYNILKPARWVGLKNFIDIFQDPTFYKALGVTLKFAFISVPLKLVFALIVALILLKGTKLTPFYRAAYYLPSILGSSVAVAILWKRMFAVDGLVNKLLGIQFAWLGSTTAALWVIILLAVWQFGSSMLIFLSAMKQIPPELYEAARVDGAGGIYSFFRITLPSIAPGIFTGALLSFALTLDDVVMADFLAGPNCLTFPMKIYNSIRKGVSPEINALETIISGLIFLGVAVYLLLKGRQDRAAAKIEPFHQTQTEN